VNSPVRAFRGVGGQPFFVDRAEGARIWDVDGNEYIDYVGTWGPAILGHAHPKIISAVQAAAERGTSFGIPNPLEVRMAEVVKAAFGQRRKTLRNALNNVVSAEQFVAAGVRPDARAEQLDVAEFIALANAS